jgi:hypothetical protein
MALAEAAGVEPGGLASPGEVAELRRAPEDAAPTERPDDYQLDRWNDDGGAVPMEAGGRAEQASSGAADRL